MGMHCPFHIHSILFSVLAVFYGDKALVYFLFTGQFILAVKLNFIIVAKNYHSAILRTGKYDNLQSFLVTKRYDVEVSVFVKYKHRICLQLLKRYPTHRVKIFFDSCKFLPAAVNNGGIRIKGAVESYIGQYLNLFRI